ncbi:MAG: HD-GYP domain-containing protein [Actinobacteria bacterium]|nr:MAG: HD-GYP domain-containing protein [Actinomycetota bacterium]
MKLGTPLKFALFCLAVSIAIFFLVGYFVSLRITRDVIDQTAEVTAMTARINVAHYLTKEDVVKPFSKQSKVYKTIDHLIKTNLLEPDYTRVKIWNSKGQIIYSDKEELIGKTYPLRNSQYQAFQGKPFAEISTLEENENYIEKQEHNTDLIEIYVPLMIDGKIMAIYETYSPIEKIQSKIYDANVAAWKIVALAITLMYICLVWSFWRANRRFEHKKTQLKTLANKYKLNVADLEESYLDTMKGLSAAVDAKDKYTSGHTLRVAYYSKKIGKALGMSDHIATNLEKAALFHDLGKIGISESILNKPGKLTVEEYEEIKKHSRIGEQIIGSIHFLGAILDVVRHHHEHYDGSGYPDGLVGKEIPIESRIIGVADAFDAMTTDRPHRQAMPVRKAISELKRNRYSQFDPVVVDVFVELIGQLDIRQVAKKNIPLERLANYKSKKSAS